jgi:hypothetical protein
MNAAAATLPRPALLTVEAMGMTLRCLVTDPDDLPATRTTARVLSDAGYQVTLRYADREDGPHANAIAALAFAAERHPGARPRYFRRLRNPNGDPVVWILMELPVAVVGGRGRGVIVGAYGGVARYVSEPRVGRFAYGLGRLLGVDPTPGCADAGTWSPV